MTLRLLAATLAVLASCNSSSSSSPATAAPATASPAAAPVVAAPAVAAPAPAASTKPAEPAQAAPRAAPTPGTVDVDHAGHGQGGPGGPGGAGGSTTPPVLHGEKWQDGEEEGRGGRFAAFKETWIYVDGVPRGALVFAELPVALPVAWKDDLESLDFRPGDTGPREKKIQLLRWRLADYLKLIGVDVSRIKMVYLQAGAYVAIPGDRFRKFSDGITFDLTGNDLSTSRFYWPTNMPTNSSHDRFAAVSVFINKPPLVLDEHNNPFIDGVEVMGIPYHGTPERGGFRVYVDNRLAMVVKRNELGAVGRIDNERWDLRKLLAARGVKVEPVAGDLVLAQGMAVQQRERLDEAYVKNLEVGVSAQASGTLLLGKDSRPATALHLYTRGRVPPVIPLPVFQRDWEPPTPVKPARPKAI